jgi:hypothetical protein
LRRKVAKGQIPLGLKTYDVDLRVCVSSVVDPATRQRTFSGNFAADLEIGEAVFAITFDFGTVNIVNGTWHTTDGAALDLGDIAKAIGINDPLPIPAGLDLGLSAVSFGYSGTQRSFTLSAQSQHYGQVFFSASLRQSPAVFVLGVEVPLADGQLSSLPDIGKDLHCLDFMRFKQVAMLVASGAAQSFTVPVLPALPPASPGGAGASAAGPRQPAGPFAAGTPLQVGPRVTLAAVIDLHAQSDRRMGHLSSMAGQSELLLQVAIGTKVAATCTLNGSATIPTGGGQHLTLQNAAVEIAVQAAPAPVTLVQLSGSMNLKVLNTPIAASARVSITDTEAAVACTISAGQPGQSIRISIPPGLGPFAGGQHEHASGRGLRAARHESRAAGHVPAGRRGPHAKLRLRHCPRNDRRGTEPALSVVRDR